MKKVLFRLAAICVSTFLFFAGVTYADAPMTLQQRLLSLKAVKLAHIACMIYPAITDLERCAEKVMQRILSVRGVTPEQQKKIIGQLRITSEERWTLPRYAQLEPARLHRIKFGEMIFGTIEISCEIEPMITEIKKCTDMAYYAILSSRDAHSAYLNPEEAAEFTRNMNNSDLEGIGAGIDLTHEKAVGVFEVFPGSPAEKAGVLEGDRIVTIINHGEEGDERTATSSLANISEGMKKIRGKPNTRVTLEILRGENDERVTVTVVRSAVKVEMVKSQILTSPSGPDVKYGYIRLVQFVRGLRERMVNETTDLIKKNPNLKGIIFDVRSNPGGPLREVYEAVDALADSPDALVSIRDNDGVHAYGTAPDDRGNTPKPQPGDITNGLPIAVFVDGRSASASEIFAGSLKELDRAVVIGKRTWGKGTVQLITNGPINDKSAVKVTTSEYLIGSPKKWVAVQCVGVDPDIFYEAEVPVKPRKEMHDCDLPGAVVSGGTRSDDNPAKAPLAERDPARYRLGLEIVEAVKALDQQAIARMEKIRKLLKLPDPKDNTEEGDK